MVLSQLNDLYAAFLSFTKSNQIVGGALSLWGLGVITYLAKGVPTRIFKFVLRETTTTLTVNSADQVFYDFLKWVTVNKNHSFVRELNLMNPVRWGTEEAILSIGYGRVYFTFNNHILYMDRVKDQSNQTAERKEEIKLTLVGRNKKVFQDLFSNIREFNREETRYTRIYQYHNDRWETACKSYKRSLKTVAVEPGKKAQIIAHIDNFMAEKQWHLDNGVPWRTGILLSGPPGTGKTSLIKALCAHYDKPVYILNLSELTDKTLQAAMATIPEKAIVAVEDMDTAGIGRPRASRDEQKTEGHGTPKSDKIEFSLLTLSGVLNAFDGLTSNDGRIIVATTNHVDSLDTALIREGRFDLKVEIGYMTDEVYRSYLSRFYPSFDFSDYRVSKNVAPCLVQKLIFDHRDDPEKVLELTGWSARRGLQDVQEGGTIEVQD